MGRNEMVGHFVVAVLLAVSSVVAVTGGGVVADAAGAAAKIEIVSLDVPERMVPGEEYQTRVKFRNTGDSAAQVEVAYIFEGTRLIMMNEIVPAGESKTVRFRVSLSDAANGVRGKLYDGTYEHGYRVGNAQAQNRVEVSGLGTTTPTETAIQQETVREDPENDREELEPGEDGPRPDAPEGDVAILKTDLPESLAAGEQVMAAVQIENRGDSQQQVDVIYFIDGQPTVGSPATVDPGERTTVRFSLSIDGLRRAYDGTLESGTHEWYVQVGETRTDGRITLGQAESGDDRTRSDGGFEDGGGAEKIDSREVGTDARPQRGFFTNGDMQAGFVDSFTLTIGGFILSTLGILHQMLKG